MRSEYPDYYKENTYTNDLIDNLNQEDKDILEKYLKECRLSSGDEKVHQRKRFVLQYRDIAQVPLKKFDREIIEGIYLLIKESDREVSGKNECVKNLKHFIRFLFDDENLVKKLKGFKQKHGYNTEKINHNTLVTDEELEGLVRSCKNLKERCLVTLMIETALRPCEILFLKWSDITIEDEIGKIKVFSPKTKETRVLPFKDCLLHVNRWRDEYEFESRKKDDLLFPNPTNSKKQLQRQYINMLFRRMCKQKGLRNITPYMLRHKRLTKINKELPEKMSSAYGGHSPQVSARYTHINSEEDIIESVLKRIYDIKEPDIKNRKKLEKELKELKKQFSTFQEAFISKKADPVLSLIEFYLKEGVIKINPEKLKEINLKAEKGEYNLRKELNLTN